MVCCVAMSHLIAGVRHAESQHSLTSYNSGYSNIRLKLHQDSWMPLDLIEVAWLLASMETEL